MIVCPVCEHAQATGGECEVCGKRLSAAGAPAPAVGVSVALEGLEPTRADAAAAVGAEPFPELEPTHHAPEDDPFALEAGAVQDLEPTRTGAVDVSLDLTPDLEPTAAAAPADAPTPVPAIPVCRYCRAPGLPGEKLCGRCGMRLPVVAAPRSRAATDGPAVCSCGAPVRAPVCPACGARHPAAG